MTYAPALRHYLRWQVRDALTTEANVGLEAACDSLADVMAGLSFSQPTPDDSALMDTLV